MPTNRENKEQDSTGDFVLDPRNGYKSMGLSAVLGTLLVELPTQRLLAVDPLASKHFDICQDKLEAYALSSLLIDLTQKQWTSLFDQNDNQVRNLSTLVRSRDGSKLRVRISFQPLKAAEQNLLLLVVESLAAVSTEIVHRDALSGLPDRRELAKRYRQLVLAAGDLPPRIALLFLDLDHFKQINDQNGHTIGDRVLATLAQRWQSCVRGDDLIVRYGGDEFIVLVANITERAEVEPIVSRFRRITAEPILVDDLTLTVQVTVGVAFSQQTSTGLDALIDLADRDMYASKPPR